VNTENAFTGSERKRGKGKKTGDEEKGIGLMTGLFTLNERNKVKRREPLSHSSIFHDRIYNIGKSIIDPPTINFGSYKPSNSILVQSTPSTN
jgi:hypothetical protein